MDSNIQTLSLIFKQIYTIYTKVCGHTFKIVDLAISATPVTDRYINRAHIQAISIGNSRITLLKRSVTFNVAQFTVSAVIVKWKHLVAITA
jgi:hypothetical protein